MVYDLKEFQICACRIVQENGAEGVLRVLGGCFGDRDG